MYAVAIIVFPRCWGFFFLCLSFRTSFKFGSVIRIWINKIKIEINNENASSPLRYVMSSHTQNKKINLFWSFFDNFFFFSVPISASWGGNTEEKYYWEKIVVIIVSLISAGKKKSEMRKKRRKTHTECGMWMWNVLCAYVVLIWNCYCWFYSFPVIVTVVAVILHLKFVLIFCSV